jgi:hypothetical protein
LWSEKFFVETGVDIVYSTRAPWWNQCLFEVYIVYLFNMSFHAVFVVLFFCWKMGRIRGNALASYLNMIRKSGQRAITPTKKEFTKEFDFFNTQILWLFWKVYAHVCVFVKCRQGLDKKEHNKNHMERHIKQIHYIDLKKTLVSSRCSCWVSNVYTRHVIHSKHGKAWPRRGMKPTMNEETNPI